MTEKKLNDACGWTNPNRYKIDWSKYFDHVYCIHYLGYKDRDEEMLKELKRVGLLESGIFSFKYTFSTPLDDVLINSSNFSRGNGNNFKKSSLNLAIGHYGVMKEALGLGYERILIIEDDIAFLKDWSLCQEILDNIPDNADIILFDKVGIEDNWKTYIENRNKNDFYAGYSVLWSTGCYAVNTKGMEHITKSQEKRFNVADFYTNEFSPTQGMKIVYDGINRVFSKTSLAIQKPAKGENITYHGESGWVYKQPHLSDCGMNVELYNI